MTDRLFDAVELKARVAALQARLAEQELHGAVILQRADLLYYTGATFQGALLIPVKGQPVAYAWRAASRIGNECPAEVRECASAGQALRAISESEFRAWQRVGMEEDVIPVALWKQFSQLWPGASLADISATVRWQRSIKSATEIRYIEVAAQIVSSVFADAANILKVGVPENAVQMELDRLLRNRGHQGFFRIRGFDSEALGIVACGESANAVGLFDGPIGEMGVNPAAPFGAGVKPLARNQPILIDSGAVWNGYHADITRTYVIGRLSDKLERAHEFCCELIAEIGARLMPGAIPKEIYEFALQRADQAGYREEFMNRGALKARFIGHGVGLELDEWPVLTKSFPQPLAKNMVLAIEPKVVFPEGAVGVEDTFLVTERGGQTITQLERGLIQVSHEQISNPVD